jgi:hypothetical protein
MHFVKMINTMGMRSLSHGPKWREWRRSVEADMHVEWEGYLPAIANVALRM